MDQETLADCSFDLISPGEHHESPLQGHATADHTERAPLMAHQDAPNVSCCKKKMKGWAE